MSEANIYFQTFLDQLNSDHPDLAAKFKSEIYFIEYDGRLKIGVNKFNPKYHNKEEYDKLWEIVNRYSEQHQQQ